IGTFLLLITLLLSFSGYLLPWDQLSIWAVTVGTNMAKYAPIAGPYTRYLMLGGRAVGDATLLRFYVAHVVGLPLIGFLLMVVHIWLQAPLLGKANPAMTPNPSKAPWYFLGLQELLARFPPLMAGVAFPTFVIVLMILVPYLDRNPSRRPSERKLAIFLF